MKTRTHTLLSLAALASLTLAAGSADAGIISTTDTGGTFSITTNIASLGTTDNDEPNPIWDGNLNNGVWSYNAAETLHYRHATTAQDPSRIWITWAQDYQIDKIGLVHSQAGLPYRIEDYQIQSLNSAGDPTVDGDWTTIGSITGNTTIFPEFVIDPVATRGIRLLITKATADGGDNLARFEEFLVQGTAVPEPSSLALMALGGLCVLRRRRSA